MGGMVQDHLVISCAAGESAGVPGGKLKWAGIGTGSNCIHTSWGRGGTTLFKAYVCLTKDACLDEGACLTENAGFWVGAIEWHWVTQGEEQALGGGSGLYIQLMTLHGGIFKQSRACCKVGSRSKGRVVEGDRISSMLIIQLILIVREFNQADCQGSWVWRPTTPSRLLIGCCECCILPSTLCHHRVGGNPTRRRYITPNMSCII